MFKTKGVFIMKKKNLTIICALAMAMSLTACGQSATTESTTTNNSTVESTTTEAEASDNATTETEAASEEASETDTACNA